MAEDQLSVTFSEIVAHFDVDNENIAEIYFELRLETLEFKLNHFCSCS